MQDLLEKPKHPKFEINQALAILSIIDMMLDAVSDGVDTITDKEIMHFMGIPDKQMLDTPINAEYDIKRLRYHLASKGYYNDMIEKTQDSFAIYEQIEKSLIKPLDK